MMFAAFLFVYTGWFSVWGSSFFVKDGKQTKASSILVRMGLVSWLGAGLVMLYFLSAVCMIFLEWMIK
ncbi:hypothetical protein [Ectobacillus panaciterrae]|uniref:hypothetical protein n=1 Tax=Ectobacillus panaciterrae TaxID=363872 RepID=UPI00040BEDBA|nr:hypothetical protein [Ectobacillus panaciterrae]